MMKFCKNGTIFPFLAVIMSFISISVNDTLFFRKYWQLPPIVSLVLRTRTSVKPFDCTALEDISKLSYKESTSEFTPPIVGWPDMIPILLNHLPVQLLAHSLFQISTTTSVLL